MSEGNVGVTPLVGLLMCFNTSSSSLSKLSLKLFCLLPVLNSLFTEIIGVLALGGLALDVMVNEGDDDDDVVLMLSIG